AIAVGHSSPWRAQEADGGSREAFLRKLDAALASRDSSRLSAIVDRKRWREAGLPELSGLPLWLPDGPLRRQRDRSQLEVHYEDDTGSSWRVRLVRGEDSPGWAIVAISRPCPVAMRRSRPGEERVAEGRPAELWTVLECWPLPR